MKVSKEATRIPIAIYGETIRTIQDVVRKRYDLSLKQIQAHRRTNKIVKARYLTFFFCREMVHTSLAVIGSVCGNGKAWDHSSVCHGAMKITKELTLKHRDNRLVYPELTQEVTELREEITKRIQAARNPNPVRRCPSCGQMIIE